MVARAQKRLESLLTWSSEILAVLDARGVVVYSSPSTERILGAPLCGELVGQVHPEDVDEVRAMWSELLSRPGIPHVVNCRLKHANGSWRHVRLHARNLLGDASVNGVVVNAPDLTDQVVAEEALRSSEDHLRRLVEGVLDYAIYTLDRRGRVASWNEGAQRMTGWTMADVLSRPFSMFFPPEDVADGVPPRLLKEAAGGGRAPFEGWRLTRTGERIWVAGAVDAVQDEDDGGLLGYVVIAQDQTDRRRTEALLDEKDAQLRQAQKVEELGRLATGVAHDFNNVLTAIGGFTRLLLEDLDPEDPRTVHVREIDRARERAAQLTMRLLRFGRLRSASPRVIDVNGVIGSLEPMLRRLLGEDVRFEVELKERLPVLIDASQFEQVIVNLAVNARDALPRGGRIRIVTAPTTTRFPGRSDDEAAVLVAVSDDGVGMDLDVQNRIFEPFFTTKADGAGTGLGLPMVAGIVSAAGGTIGVMSSPGQGTTFNILLPRADPQEMEAAPAGVAAVPTTAPASARVLLTEDDASVRLLARTVLRRRGYTVLEASSGEEALDLFDEVHGAIDLLITDAILPGMNGRVLAERLLARAPGLRVLYISGYADTELLPKGVLEEEITLVQKPFTPDELLEAVAGMLAAGG